MASRVSVSWHQKQKQYKLILSVLQRYLKKNLKSSSKAFIISYIYIVVPKLLTRIAKIFSNHNFFESKEWQRLEHLLRNAMKSDKLPAFMFRLIFTLNSIDPILYFIFSRWTSNFQFARILSLFIASLGSATLNFPRFQYQLITKHRFYSLDLSLFVIVRSFDTLISSIFDRYSISTTLFDLASFLTYSFLIMHSWFYYPEKLPPAYRNWITKAADMDYELIELLRLLHHEQMFYGKPSPNDAVLVPLCERIGIDPKLGNPATNYPIPCEIVHANYTKNCEVHALIRFVRGFKFASGIYFPLNLILLLISIIYKRHGRGNFIKQIRKYLLSAIRSSSFLACFIAFNWYPICLVRNKIGPFLYKRFPKYIDINFDKNLAVTVGCLSTGLSSLIETAKRRRDLALFCAPKALLTVIPLEPSLKNLKLESFSFSLFFAILVCYAKLRPEKVRGIYGRLISFLLRE